MPVTNNAAPPNLPVAPTEYDRQYHDEYSRILRLFFVDLTKVGPISGSSLNLNVNVLPTEADLGTLRSGDVYRNTADNTLRIKP